MYGRFHELSESFCYHYTFILTLVSVALALVAPLGVMAGYSNPSYFILVLDFLRVHQNSFPHTPLVFSSSFSRVHFFGIASNL